MSYSLTISGWNCSLRVKIFKIETCSIAPSDHKWPHPNEMMIPRYLGLIKGFHNFFPDRPAAHFHGEIVSDGYKPTLWNWGSSEARDDVFSPTEWGAKERQNPQNHKVVTQMNESVASIMVRDIANSRIIIGFMFFWVFADIAGYCPKNGFSTQNAMGTTPAISNLT